MKKLAFFGLITIFANIQGVIKRIHYKPMLKNYLINLFTTTAFDDENRPKCPNFNTDEMIKIRTSRNLFVCAVVDLHANSRFYLFDAGDSNDIKLFQDLLSNHEILSITWYYIPKVKFEEYKSKQIAKHKKRFSERCIIV